jgi:predicted AAA+ superfamily ATPase
VDFLLKRGHELLAFEVKSGQRFSTSMLSGLRAIENLPSLVRRILIYAGRHALKTHEGIEVWPLGDFLRALQTGRLWP